MDYKDGFAYHIKESYFDKVNDDKLMKNKENGNYRPTYYCYKEADSQLIWVVPMSTQVEKFRKIAQKSIDKYGECNGIYIDKFDGKENAFLIQNMFPITEKYISHIHTRNNNPVPVNANIKKEVKKRVNKALALLKKGKKIIFPDVKRLKKMMIDELNTEKSAERKNAAIFSRATQKAFAEKAAEQPMQQRNDKSKDDIIH